MKLLFIVLFSAFLTACSGMSDSMLSPDQQKDLQTEYQSKPPEERRALRAYYFKFKKLPKSERGDLLDKWSHLSEKRRQYLIDKAKKLNEKQREVEADKFFAMPNQKRLDYLDTAK